MALFDVDAAYVSSHLPPRPPESHKGSYGRAVLVCGSDRYRGAALLALGGTLRCGAGLTLLCAPASVTAAAVIAYPEAICLPREAASDAAASASAVLIGCGCGQSEELYALLTACLTAPGCPLVLDADALNTLAAHGEEGGALLAASPRPVVLTPHPLEFARLSGMSVAQVQEDRTAAAAELAARLHATVVLKGAGTVVACPDGSVSRNTSGCAALAKGGSGDVLAGCITAFLAQGCRPEEAARIAVYLHGRAGETLAQTRSLYGVLPSELACAIAGEIAKL